MKNIMIDKLNQANDVFSEVWNLQQQEKELNLKMKELKVELHSKTRDKRLSRHT